MLNLEKSRFKNKSLFALIIINGVFIFGANMFPPIFALFVKNLGGNAFSAGLIWAIFAITSGVAIFFVSLFGDKLKEKEYLLAISYVIRAVSWLGYFFVNALWQIYVIQFVLAIGEAFGTPVFSALFSQHLDSGQYVREWSTWTALSFILIGIASLLGGAIVSFFGFGVLFLIMSVLAVISFAFLIIQPRKLL